MEIRLTDSWTGALRVGRQTGDPFGFLTRVLALRLPGFRTMKHPEQLSGGLLNYVWRLQGSPESTPGSIIVKWAPPYIATSPGVALDPRRLAIEAKAMSAFEADGPLAAVELPEVRAPRLFMVDDQQHVLAMEDVGRWPDLGTWLHLPSSDPTQAESIAASLGRFVGLLHRVSFEQPGLAQEFDNSNIQRTRLEFQYGSVGDYARRAQLPDADALGGQAVEFGKLLQEPGVCTIMGDLWPPSVIVTDSGLRIIDWELAHYGRPSQDVGHLAAHLWMHGHRAASADASARAGEMLRGFLQAYRAATHLVFDRLFGAQGVFESSIHFGSEVLTRTVGVFQDGYLYNGLAVDDPIIEEAAEVAATHIRHPLDVNTFDALGWRE